MNTIRRDTLRRQLEAGLLEAKCTLHLTDDYAFDKANSFGVTHDWLPARLQQGPGDWKNGFVSLSPSDFEGRSGYASREEDGTIRLKVHSNLYFTLRMKQEPCHP